jgi:hypothetical protein
MADPMNIRGLGKVALAIALTAPLFVSRTAHAQAWLADRRYQEGPGYRTGDFEIHPGIGGEIGYDSNWFLRSSNSNVDNGCPKFCPQGAPEMRITPSLTLSTIGPQRREGEARAPLQSYKLTAGLAGTYYEFFNALSPQQRNVGLSGNTRLDILPEHPFGAAIYANYARLIQPSIFGEPDLSFNRDDVGAGAEIIAQPGGGTLDWRLGYQFHDTIFEETAGQPYGNIVNEANTRGRWKFRPRTALLYDATLRWYHYVDNGAGITQLHDSSPVRARLGINGLITPRFSVLAMAGWGASFFEPSSSATVHQYDSVIGQAELKWFLTAAPGTENGISLSQSSIAVGYTRDFQNSYLADYFGTDRGYLNFSYFFAGRALLSLTGGVGAVEYPEITPLNGGTPHAPFTDMRADATFFGEYRFFDSLGVNATVRYTTNISGETLNLGVANTGGPTGLYAMEWQRFEAYIGVRWLM